MSTTMHFKQSLQYYMNMYLDDQYHDSFREYLKYIKEDEDEDLNDQIAFNKIEDFKEYKRHMAYDYEDFYMTKGL